MVVRILHFMSIEYHIQKTSRQSADVQDQVLSETKTTRLVLRSMILDNPKNIEAKIKISLVHQRKSPNGLWEDAPSISLATLKAGEEIKLSLDSEATLELYRQLINLFALANHSNFKDLSSHLVVADETETIKTDSGLTKLIKDMLKNGYSKKIFEELSKADPEQVLNFSYSQIQMQRQIALAEFKLSLNQQKSESYWQNFFKNNTWIFGYGLRYQFLSMIQDLPHYGGENIAGKGMEKGDFLACTEGDIKFTVLVEIKRPDSPLLGKDLYRSNCWSLGEDLTGGVSQLQTNCRRWEIDGSKAEQNREKLQKQHINTVIPKGILVIGNTCQLNDDLSKRNTFELYRRNLINPEIITFDELFERAKFIVGTEIKQ